MLLTFVITDAFQVLVVQTMYLFRVTTTIVAAASAFGICALAAPLADSTGVTSSTDVRR